MSPEERRKIIEYLTMNVTNNPAARGQVPDSRGGFSGMQSLQNNPFINRNSPASIENKAFKGRNPFEGNRQGIPAFAAQNQHMGLSNAAQGKLPAGDMASEWEKLQKKVSSMVGDMVGLMMKGIKSTGGAVDDAVSKINPFD